jgi:hypothetical protein
MNDATEIRDIVESWVIWRDTGDRERLRGTWHADGRMMATWFEGTADEFIARAKRGRETGLLSQHTLGGFAVQVNGDRAVARKRVTLCVRGMVEGAERDGARTARF